MAKRPTLIVLDPLLETGDATVDRQHQELFERVAALLDAAREHRSAEEVQHMLDFLGNYVARHFEMEERLMQRGGFPGIQAHRLEHEDFTREFRELDREFKAEGPSLTFVVRFSNRVTAWLRDHIYRADREMAGWLRDHPPR